MMNILCEKFNIVIDGRWNTNEMIAAAICAVAALLVLWLAVKIIVSIIAALNPRKSTIFSHRKNKYKNRIGKKIKY